MIISSQIIFSPNWSVLHHPGSKQILNRTINTELICSRGEKLITIQFGSLEHIIVPIESQIPLIETSLFMEISDEVDDDEGGWTFVTRRRPRK